MTNPKVYIILINYGTPDDTIACMNSILQNSYQQFQVVVVDVNNINHSVDSLSKWIDDQNDTRFKLIKEKENRGFAYANNVGIKYALSQNNCNFLWVLNNDTVIDKTSLTKQINFYTNKSKNEKVGFIGVKTMSYHNPEIIQNVGGVFNKLTKFPEWIGSGEKDRGQYDNKELVIDHIQGSSMFFHPSLIDATGLMPEDYFLYFEDTDWCVKAQRAGYVNKVCTSAIIYHKQGVSTGINYIDDAKALQNKQYFYRNLLKFYKRFFKPYLPAAYLFLLKKWAGSVVRKKHQEAHLLWKVIWLRTDKL